jgi:hypothetical protein
MPLGRVPPVDPAGRPFRLARVYGADGLLGGGATVVSSAIESTVRPAPTTTTIPFARDRITLWGRTGTLPQTGEP